MFKKLFGLILFFILSFILTITVFAGTLKEKGFWCDENVSVEGVTKITFQTSPFLGNYDLTWDASNDGTVTGYLVDTEIIIVSNDTLFTNKNASGMFNDFSNLEIIEGLDLLNTSKTTDMSSMFRKCSSLSSLDISTFDTSKVVDMNRMFSIASDVYSGALLGEGTETQLSNLVLGNIDTSNVENMEAMFEDCDALVNLDVSMLNTSKVKSFNNMFHNCTSLETLDLSNFDTSNATDFSYMFYDCIALEGLDVSSFNITKAKNVAFMFNSLWGITSLDLSNFADNNITNFRGMFWDCKNCEEINISNLVTSHATDTVGTFGMCKKLARVDVEENCKLTAEKNIFYYNGEKINNNNEVLDPKEDVNESIYDGEVVFNDLIETPTIENTEVTIIEEPAVKPEKLVEENSIVLPSATVEMTATDNSTKTNKTTGGSSGGGGGGGGGFDDSNSSQKHSKINWVIYADGIKALDSNGNIYISCWINDNNNWYIVDDKGNKILSALILNNNKYYSLDTNSGAMRILNGEYLINNKIVNLKFNPDGSIINYQDILNFNVVPVKTLK